MIQSELNFQCPTMIAEWQQSGSTADKNTRAKAIEHNQKGGNDAMKRREEKERGRQWLDMRMRIVN